MINSFKKITFYKTKNGMLCFTQKGRCLENAAEMAEANILAQFEGHSANTN